LYRRLQEQVSIGIKRTAVCGDRENEAEAAIVRDIWTRYAGGEGVAKDLAATSGRAPEDIVEDALAGYLEEVASVRKTLDSRYDDLKSGRVKPIDGEEAFRKLRDKSERRRSGG
jgi:hypothetical protein